MRKQRVVIITGAAGGIGRALVDAHLNVGDIVVAADLPDSGVLELARAFGAADLGLEFDVSREEDILALYERIDAQFDHIDVLVNNAAMGPSMAATTQTPIDDFRRVLAVNLIGPFLMAREAARRMQPGAAIINVASMAGDNWQSKTQRLRCFESGPYLDYEVARLRVGFTWHPRDGSGAGLCANADGRAIGTRWPDELRGGAQPCADGAHGASGRNCTSRAVSRQPGCALYQRHGADN
ncbi:NAD(P)-dependent dehydrogenase (short-subunit alcohol dehydrogenase family) [Rhizobium leucaenae]|nr:NAD(P)-dependent dehydrogenase (short-subunit alcohol dehydrogenase family) [Rhizobium leucaenae]